MDDKNFNTGVAKKPNYTFAVIIFVTAIIIIFSLVLAFVLNSDENSTNNSQDESQNSQENDNSTDNSGKLLVNTKDKFLADANFPDRINDLSKTELFSLECSNSYIFDAQGWYRNENNNRQDVKETNLKNFIANNPQSLENSTEIYICDSENNSSIIIATFAATQTNTTFYKFFKYISPENELLSEIQTGSNLLGKCNDPIAYTQKDIFYVICSTSEMDYSTKTILSVDFESAEAIVEVKCESTDLEKTASCE